ncbi:MAG TPA: ComEC/Rec2 family competence protein [Candidatus Krumholzibacteria bacterium]|nr:ComEC/Rec2 family competence protein [Candidatus Krumholzibacteria bacterium]
MVWLFSLGVVAGVYRSFSLIVILMLALLARAALLRAAHAWVCVPLALACGVVGWASIERVDADRGAVERAARASGGAAIRLCGWVDEFPQSGRYGTTFSLATRVEGRPVRLWVRAGRFDVGYGDSLAIDARLASASRTPSVFLVSRGLAGEARARFEDVREIGTPRGCPLLREVLWPMHRAARCNLARALGGEAALPVGLLLGERGMLDRRAHDAVRGLGITHLLALSGMHLTMIAALAVFATRWSPRRRDTVVALALSLYVGVVGNVDSLTRAWWMALLILASRALVRPPRPLDALGKALFLMLLCAPHAVLSVGLQLSFVATFAVLVSLERLPSALLRSPPARAPLWRRAGIRAGQGAAIAFMVSLVVEVFIAPLQVHHFGRISVVGPLATVVFLIPVTVLQGMALAASFGLPVVGEPLAALLAWASRATCEAIVLAGTTAPEPLEAPEPHWFWYYAAVLVVCARPRRAVAWAMAAAGIALSLRLGAGS